MVYTNFPSGITSFGIPTFGTGALPPSAGAFVWVNEAIGSDGNPGTATQPVATLTQALLIVGNFPGSTSLTNFVLLQGTVHVSATVAWNKNNTWLVGLNAPSGNDRARISQTGSTVFTPLVNVTANGCGFIDIATFHGFANASAQICWAEAGGRNYYQNVQFYGMGDATAAAQAGGRSITVGSDENVFNGCTFGLDTITRSTSNATMEFINHAARNKFYDATFQMLTSSASAVHITAAASSMDRYALFVRPSLLNSVESTSTTINAAVTANASAGGFIALQDLFSVGATAIATTGPVYGTGNIPTATTSGIAIKLT